MGWEIYAYWNINELAAVITAIQRVTDAGDFIGLIAMVMSFGALAAVVGALSGQGDLIQPWKWLVMALFFYMTLLVPKVDVALIDRTGVAPAEVVQDVPIFIAVFGSVTSTIGDWLTTVYETNLAIIDPPYVNGDGLKFQSNGLLFGHRIVDEVMNFSTIDTVLRMNATEFYEKCVFPELDTGNIHIGTIMNSKDIWSDISNVNPSLFITLYDVNGTPEVTPITCTAAYARLGGDMISASNTEIQRSANRMYPQMSQADAKNAFSAALTSTASYHFNVSDSAVNLFKQRLAANSFLNAGELSQQDIYAKSQAETIARQQYSTLSQIAQTTIPKLRNVIEVVLYAVFPIIIVMIVIGGTKGIAVIKTYLVGLFWIQLWAPLYAIMNFMVTAYRQKEWLASFPDANAFTIHSAAAINAGAQSDMNIAGMLAISIPMISYAMVKGGEMAMTSFVSGATAPAQSAASSAANGVAMGNLQQGSVTMDSKSSGVLNMNKHDTQPMANDGAAVRMGNDGYKYTTSADGSVGVDDSARRSKSAALNMEMANKEVASAKHSYDTSIEAAQTHKEAADHSRARSFAHSGALGIVANNDKGWGSVDASKHSEGVQQTFKTLSEGTKTLSANKGWGADKKAKFAADIAMAINDGWGVSSKAALVNSYGEDIANKAEEKFQHVTKADMQEAATFMDDFSTSEDMQKKFGLKDDAKTELKAGAEETAKQTKLHDATMKESEGYKNQWEKAKERQLSAKADLMALTDINNLDESTRGFITGGGREQWNEYLAAKSSGNSELAKNKLQAFNASFYEHKAKIGDGVSGVKPGENPKDTDIQKADATPVTPTKQKQAAEEAHAANVADVEGTGAGNKAVVEAKAKPVAAAVSEEINQKAKDAKTQEQYMADLENHTADETAAVKEDAETTLASTKAEVDNSAATKRLKEIDVDEHGIPTTSSSESYRVLSHGVKDLSTTMGRVFGEDSAPAKLMNSVSEHLGKLSENPAENEKLIAERTAQIAENRLNNEKEEQLQRGKLASEYVTEQGMTPEQAVAKADDVLAKSEMQQARGMVASEYIKQQGMTPEQAVAKADEVIPLRGQEEILADKERQKNAQMTYEQISQAKDVAVPILMQAEGLTKTEATAKFFAAIGGVEPPAQNGSATPQGATTTPQDAQTGHNGGSGGKDTAPTNSADYPQSKNSMPPKLDGLDDAQKAEVNMARMVAVHTMMEATGMSEEAANAKFNEAYNGATAQGTAPTAQPAVNAQGSGTNGQDGSNGAQPAVNAQDSSATPQGTAQNGQDDSTASKDTADNQVGATPIVQKEMQNNSDMTREEAEQAVSQRLENTDAATSNHETGGDKGAESASKEVPKTAEAQMQDTANTNVEIEQFSGSDNPADTFNDNRFVGSQGTISVNGNEYTTTGETTSNGEVVWDNGGNEVYYDNQGNEMAYERESNSNETKGADTHTNTHTNTEKETKVVEGKGDNPTQENAELEEAEMSEQMKNAPTPQ